MVVPIAPKLTAVCLACTEPGIVAWLKDKSHEIIDVPFEDTVALGCNFIRELSEQDLAALIKQGP